MGRACGIYGEEKCTLGFGGKMMKEKDYSVKI
jgi:hypothetical protein